MTLRGELHQAYQDAEYDAKHLDIGDDPVRWAAVANRALQVAKEALDQLPQDKLWQAYQGFRYYYCGNCGYTARKEMLIRKDDEVSCPNCGGLNTVESEG